MHRRTLIRWMLSGAAAWPLRGVRLHAQAASLPETSVATLRAVAAAVLPSELGAAGHDKVTGDFVRWLGAYKPGAERPWGYGAPTKTVTPVISAGAYEQQLRALEDQARRQGASFTTLPVTARQALITSAVDAAGVKNLPGSPNGTHVAADLMSFYFTSSEATDLCYRARIARETCRGLGNSARKPAAL